MKKSILILFMILLGITDLNSTVTNYPSSQMLGSFYYNPENLTIDVGV